MYPFQILNTDYKNRVISLIFASGVSREKYYFVKVGATILCTLTAMIAITLFPILSILGDVMDLQMLYDLPFDISLATFFLQLLSSTVVLTTAVIITKGKMSGIFLYFGFLFAASILSSTISSSFLNISEVIRLMLEISILVYIGLHV
jgi:hypothetical protein